MNSRVSGQCVYTKVCEKNTKAHNTTLHNTCDNREELNIPEVAFYS